MSKLNQRRLAVAGLIAGLTLPVLSPAFAADRVCIQSQRVSNTVVTDDSTIYFQMNDHKIWKNTLTAPCGGLKIASMAGGGFVYTPTNPNTEELCSNMQTITLRQTGAACLLGDFTPVDQIPPR